MNINNVYPSEVDSMLALVKRAKEQFGSQTYIIPTETALDNVSFDDVYEFVQKFGDYLDEKGVGENQAVTTVFHNSTLLTLFFIAIIANNRVFVPLNPKMGESEIKHVCNLTEPVLTIFAKEFSHLLKPIEQAGMLEPIEDEVQFYKNILARDQKNDQREEVPCADMDSCAEIVFTSGSTGLPKGAQITHRGLLKNSFSLAITYEFDEQSRFLTACPLFHNSGQLFTTLTALWCGGLHVPVRSDFAMVNFWHLCDKYELQWTLVMNAFLSLLLQRRETPAKNTIKGILSGGSKLKLDLVDSFEQKFDTPVYQCYGLTETTSFSTAERPGRSSKGRGSAGKPLPSCDIKIVTEGAEMERGESGEILIRGEHLFSGYIKQPEITAEKLKEGWLYTGDLGYMDDENNVFIIDRLDSMIHVGGENVYPSEIENLSILLDGVEDVIVSDIPHKILGSELIMVYKIQEGKTVDPDTWAEVFSEHLSAFKIPRKYVSVDTLAYQSIPRAANGKLLRAKIKKSVMKHLAN
jgi:long-chain acyl-CoA synthetase